MIGDNVQRRRAAAVHKMREGFEREHRETALTNGTQPEAVEAAFNLAAMVECAMHQDPFAVSSALNAYWRSVGVVP